MYAPYTRGTAQERKRIKGNVEGFVAFIAMQRSRVQERTVSEIQKPLPARKRMQKEADRGMPVLQKIVAVFATSCQNVHPIKLPSSSMC